MRTLYDRVVDRLLRFDPAAVSLAVELATTHPDAALAHVPIGYLQLSSTDGADVAGGRRSWEAMASLAMNDRERLHHEALGAWVGGDWRGAAAALDRLLERWPDDLLALQIGQQLDFSIGDTANLRDRPARSLVDLDPEDPHTGFVRGMLAFGLEECGHYGEAEASGLAALDANPDDVWAVHAVAHVHEMQGRVDDGIRFMEAREPDWGAGNLFTVHNWWHLALFHLEAGDVDRVLAIYDAEVRGERTPAMALPLVDASALLWRLHLDGVDTGSRFAVLADLWAPKVDGPPWYAFNDVHAVMALVGAGRLDDAEQVIERLCAYVHRNGGATNVHMTAEVGLPAARAVLRFGQGRYDDVVAELAPIRRTSHRFGGSHAQRDVLGRTLLEAALRGGHRDLARALIAERLALRPTSAYAKAQRERWERAS